MLRLLNTNKAPLKTLNNRLFDARKDLLKKYENTGEVSSHLSHCLLTMEPVELEESTFLFGGKIKSKYTNKLVLRTALFNQGDEGNYKLGDVLFEAFISDEALSTAMINTNSKSSPITIVNAMGDELDYRNRISQKTNIEKVKELRDEDLYYSQDSLNSVMFMIVKVLEKKVMSKKDRDYLSMILENSYNNLSGNASDNVNTLTKELKKSIDSVDIEINSSIDKIMKLRNKDTVKRLTDESFQSEDSKRLENILLFSLLGGLTDEEREGLSLIYKKLIDHLQFGDIADRARKYKETLDKIRREPSINPTDGSFSISNIIGDFDFFGRHYSNEPIIKIDFNSAKINVHHGKDYLEDIGTKIRLTMRASELLSLVRCHKTKPSECLVSLFAGYQVPYKEMFVSKEYQAENNLKTDLEMHRKGLKQVSDEIIALVSKRVKKDDVPVLIEKAEEYKALINKLMSETLTKSDIAFNEVEEQFKSKFKENINYLASELSEKEKTVLLEML